MKKIAGLILAVMMLMTCCSAIAETQSFTIGILQQLQHVALDSATQGFKDALIEKLGEENVTFEYQNASNDASNCQVIAGTLVAKNVDLIMANATMALQSCYAATEDIPILGTSITEYQGALSLSLNENGALGTNVSGTSDLAPLDQQAAMVLELFPDTKVVGLLYCSAEPNSVFQVTEIAKYLADLGVETADFSFTDSNDITAVAETAVKGCDVIYIPTDNTAAENTEAIYNVVVPAGIPVIAGEEGICAGCGVATLSISYYDIGYETGLMAYEILVEGADITQMPVHYAPKFTKEYNAAIAAELNVEIPEDYIVIE